jgi:hypothetical protein
MEVISCLAVVFLLLFISASLIFRMCVGCLNWEKSTKYEVCALQQYYLRLQDARPTQQLISALRITQPHRAQHLIGHHRQPNLKQAGLPLFTSPYVYRCTHTLTGTAFNFVDWFSCPLCISKWPMPRAKISLIFVFTYISLDHIFIQTNYDLSTKKLLKFPTKNSHRFPVRWSVRVYIIIPLFILI